MADDGDELATALGILGAISAATGLASTGLALSKKGPKLPAIPPPAPPPVPPPVPPLPPAPTDTQVDEAVTKERRKQQRRFGVSNTLLASPLGGGNALPAEAGKTLLGG